MEQTLFENVKPQHLPQKKERKTLRNKHCTVLKFYDPTDDEDCLVLYKLPKAFCVEYEAQDEEVVLNSLETLRYYLRDHIDEDKIDYFLSVLTPKVSKAMGYIVRKEKAANLKPQSLHAASMIANFYRAAIETYEDEVANSKSSVTSMTLIRSVLPLLYSSYGRVQFNSNHLEE